MDIAYANTILPPFHVAMYRLCKVGLDVVRDRSKAMSSRDSFARITRLREEISTITTSSAPHLRDARACRSHRDSIEHWALSLHVSYITSELLRPAISPSTQHNADLARHFRQPCLDSLADVVAAWLGLQNVTAYARHSWASVHRALSCALLLGIMGEHARNERCRRLLGRFVALIGDITGSVDPQEIAAPMGRAIAALRRLDIHGPMPASETVREPQQARYESGVYRHHQQEHIANRPSSRFVEDIAVGAAQSLTPEGIGLSDQSMEMRDQPLYQPLAPGSIVSGLGSTDETSPYAVLNHILWGHGRSPQGL